MHEQQAAGALAALGNRTRLRLFRLLVKAGDDGLIVGDVQKHMSIPASTLSHHLTVLARAGLVNQEKQGREIVSTAAFTEVHALVNYLTEECCAGVGHGSISSVA